MLLSQVASGLDAGCGDVGDLLIIPKTGKAGIQSLAEIKDPGVRPQERYVKTEEGEDVIPVGVFDCQDPQRLESDLTSERYTMKLKYATVTHDFRDTRYFYFVPELTMPEIEGLKDFTVQLYTQLVTSDVDGRTPTVHPCTSPVYETVALTAIVNSQIDLCKQTWFLKQYRGKAELYGAPGNWKTANQDQLYKENQVTEDMLWGWDATESAALSFMREIEDEEGKDVLESTYEFKAAAYRNFENKGSAIDPIVPSAYGDKESPNALYIKFGFKIWGDGDEVIKQGESKFYVINAMSAVESLKAGLALFGCFSMILTLM